MDIIYTCNHEINVPSPLSPQQFCGNSCTQVMMYSYTLFYDYMCILCSPCYREI